MSANPINVVEFRKSVVYDGTNRLDIAALFSLTHISEVAGVWSFESPPASTVWNVPTGHSIIFTQNMAIAVMSPTELASVYTCNTVCTDIADVAAAVDALGTQVDALETEVDALETEVDGITAGGAAVRAAGIGPLGAFLLNQTKTIAVTIKPTMPNTSFTPHASLLSGTVSIVGLVINSVSIVDTSTVNVVVQSVGLATLAGANVLVTANA